MNNFDARFEGAFGKVSFVVNRYLLEHMTRIMRELDLDLDSAYLWGLLANMSVMHLLGPGSGITPQRLLDEDMTIELKGVRLSDLTQITGMPRETVRRKLVTLQQRGKVSRDANGLWVLNREGINSEVRAFTKETVVRFLRVAEEMNSILEEVDV